MEETSNYKDNGGEKAGGGDIQVGQQQEQS